MKSVEEAPELIRKSLPDFGTCEVLCGNISGGEMADDIFADRDYPPFHRVMMDGIAVKWNVVCEGLREFQIIGICPAGEPAKTLSDAGSTYEVMTGAPLPDGADLVIPYEHLKIENGKAVIIREERYARMENVHLAGSDAQKGELLLSPGQVNGPHWGIAASVGKTKIKVKRKPKVNIISTGDELVPVDSIPQAHQIRRSNAYALKASLELHGFSEIELSHLPDEIKSIEDHYSKASQKFDLLLYSGGVSQGKFDYLPATWKNLGVKEIFHGVSQRPGKPLWFGTDEKTQTVVMGLPGNPVSSLVCLHRYLLSDKKIYAVLSEDFVFKKDLTCFVPVILEFSSEGLLIAHPLSIKNSGEFSALAGSDGFIELPREKSLFKKGEAYLFHPWRKM